MENRYDRYKDSGIAWIGEIPEHWKIIPHKRIMRKKKIIKEIYAGENILSLTKKGVIIRDLEAGGKMPTTFNGYQILYPNNLLLCLFDIDVTPRCVGIIKNVGLSSPAYSQFVLNKLGHTPFFDYLLKYMDDEKCLLHLSKNLRNSLTEEDFGQIETILPPISEQQAIADYLDRRCSEIDDLIALQEEMITKLQSYKQSVITEAVTRGLDKNVPLKDSGIDWIGKVPEHWEITLFKRKITINNGKDYKNFSDAEIYPVIGSGGCFAYCSNYMYDGEALLLGRKGTIDKPLYVKGKFWAVDTMFYAIPHKDLHCKFSYYLALTFPFNLYSTSTSLPSLTQTDLGNIPVAFPSISEQQAIADYLDQRCSEIDELIALKQQKIEKLKEYKKSLIFECVTGKRKVS